MADGVFLDSVPEVTPQLAISAYNVLRDFCRYHDCVDCTFYETSNFSEAKSCHFSKGELPIDWRDMDVRNSEY